jgi:hypothetical protein
LGPWKLQERLDWIVVEWLQDYENVSLVLTVYPGRTTDMTSGFLVMLGAGIANTHVSALLNDRIFDKARFYKGRRSPSFRTDGDAPCFWLCFGHFFFSLVSSFIRTLTRSVSCR